MSATLDTSVRQAMRNLLLAVGGLPASIGWENVAFTPAADVSWVAEARLAPLPRITADMGSTTNHVFAEYLYEVHFGTPRFEGPEQLEVYAGLLMSSIRPATQFTVEGQTVRVTRVARSSIMYPDERPFHAVVACTFTLASLALNT